MERHRTCFWRASRKRIDTDVRVGRGVECRESQSVPWLESLGDEFGEHPPVGGVARGVQQCFADHAVVRVVERSGAEGWVIVEGQQDVGPVAPDHLGDVTAKLQ